MKLSNIYIGLTCLKKSSHSLDSLGRSVSGGAGGMTGTERRSMDPACVPVGYKGNAEI